MLGKNIRYLRQRRDMSQRELSEKLGYTSATTIYKWENGENRPRMNALVALSRIFGVSIDDLSNVDLEARDRRKQTVVTFARALPVLANTTRSDEVTQEDYDAIYFVDESVRADFCMRIADNSLESINLRQGDVLLLEREFDACDGMLCAVLIKEERRVLVRFVSIQSNMIMLTAGTSSLAYKKEAVRILGTAVAVVHKVQDNDSI